MAISRRTALTAMTAASSMRVMGANDRVGVGFVGYGLIGARHVFDFKNQADTDLVAVAETYQPRMEQGVAACGGKAKGYRDFRKLLDDKDVEAVVVSTPDHWHTLVSMMACAAGKDVYVEKPMTVFVREGRWLSDVAKKHKRIVQVGTQQRSGKHYQAAMELIRSGYIGKMHSARMASFRNIMPGFGAPSAASAPIDFDYDMWLGPAPARPYSPHRGLYHFRWFWDYSGGQMTNLGAHVIDIVQWYMKVDGPVAVSSSGGRFALDDDGETPDTQDALFEYPGFTALWSHREASAGRRLEAGQEFLGTKGGLYISRGGFDVFSDQRVPPENAVPVFKGHPSGGPQRVEAKPEPWIQPIHQAGSSDEQFDLHVKNFLECVKTRKPTIADAESGHRVATACHLANISLRLGRKLRWDPVKEEIAGDSEASAMLERPYRKLWDQVLRSLLA
jgi:predicted dehydrogenase